MSQHWPNFTEVSPRRGPAPVQTVRVSYTITSNDSSQLYADIPITFDVPFADANYTVALAIQSENDPLPTNFATGVMRLHAKAPGGFTLHAPGISSSLIGTVITAHVVAFHD